jgi:very-short-patch-repair endonuclease
VVGGDGSPSIRVGVIPWKPGWPKCYRIDIAEPKLLIAVEVDGASHRDARQQLRDRRKAALLRRRGWTVLRFWNSEVQSNLEQVVERVLEAIAKKSGVSTCRPVVS